MSKIVTWAQIAQQRCNDRINFQKRLAFSWKCYIITVPYPYEMLCIRKTILLISQPTRTLMAEWMFLWTVHYLSTHPLHACAYICLYFSWRKIGCVIYFLPSHGILTVIFWFLFIIKLIMTSVEILFVILIFWRF